VIRTVVLLCCLSALCTLSASAQVSDTVVFSFEDFRTLLVNNHPMARQAALQKDKGESSIRRARGNFDPKLEAVFSEKEYKGKEYYNLTNAQIKIPTIAAAELKGGFDLNSGEFLNPEDITPNNGLITAGVSLPLLQGLVIDERRAALRMAQAFNEFSIREQQVMVNDLLIRAYTSYWEWWASYEKVLVARDIERVAAERFVAVRSRALAGQAPIIDTVEAFIQVQLRRQNVQEARANEVKNRMMLSTFLWEGGDNPVARVLSSINRPEMPLMAVGSGPVVLRNFEKFVDSVAVRNPYLAQFEFKLESLTVEERFKREKLKPKLNLNYNILSHNTGGSNLPENTAFSPNNYKWGIDFSFPILLRESRGDVQLQRIKILETRYDQVMKTQEVKNKARAAYENSVIIAQQLEIAQSNLRNYQTLLEGERIRFFNGESSLFLVNQRELQFVDARNKLIDIQAKLRNLENEALFWLGAIE
jgi:outer membrane protein TolC